MENDRKIKKKTKTKCSSWRENKTKFNYLDGIFRNGKFYVLIKGRKKDEQKIMVLRYFALPVS